MQLSFDLCHTIEYRVGAIAFESNEFAFYTEELKLVKHGLISGLRDLAL